MKLDRNFPDFVEKQSAAMRQFEAADTVADRAGERAFDMAEEFALEQFARNGRAVHADQRTVAASARLVNGARYQFLARAGFAADQDRRVGGGDQFDLREHALRRRGMSEDFMMVAFLPDFLLQVGVLGFEATLQSLHLVERLAQFLGGFAALADVAEDDHRADDLSAVADRRGGVLDRKRTAVAPPEHFVIDAVHRAVPECAVNRTAGVRVMRSVGMAVVDGGVHVAADDIFGAPAQHAFGRGIDEGRDAFGVDAVNAFAGGAQNELVLALDIAENTLGAQPCLEAALHVTLGLVVDLALAERGEIRDRDGQAVAFAPQKRAGILDVERSAGRMARRQASRPPRAFREHGLREYDQGRALAVVQRAHRDRQQVGAAVAEQIGGRRVRIQDAVGRGIHDEDGRADGLEGREAEV